MKPRTLTTLATVFGLACLMGFTPGVQAQNRALSRRGQLSQKDYRFVREAARGGMMEVELGKVAQEKGAIAAVQNFGQRMMSDHGKADSELRALAQSKGVTLPKELTRKQRTRMEHLSKLTGARFDKAYAQDMVKDHTHDVRAFEKAASSLQDPELRAFAQKTLPILKEHLAAARDMKSAVGNQS